MCIAFLLLLDLTCFVCINSCSLAILKDIFDLKFLTFDFVTILGYFFCENAMYVCIYVVTLYFKMILLQCNYTNKLRICSNTC